MSPYQHGEVYVTEDGAETDLDLGHYERFIDEDLNKYSNLTTGKVYWTVLEQGAPRRVSGQHRAGHSRTSPTRSRHFIYHVGQKDRARTWSSPRSAAPPATSRASPLSRRSGRSRLRSGGRTALYPRDARAVSRGLGRAQIQAHAALRQGAAGHGHFPEHHRRCAATSRSSRREHLPQRSQTSAMSAERLRHREHARSRCCTKRPLMLEKAHMGDTVCRKLGLGQPQGRP